MEKETILESSEKATIKKPWLKYYTEEAITSPLPENTIYGYLYQNNRRNQNRVALNYFDRKITYQQLFYEIDKVTLALLVSGVKKGDIVTIAMPTTPEAIYLFYALNRIGAVSNMVDPRSSKAELEHYANEVGSKLLFTIDKAAPKFKDVIANTTVKEVVTISPADSLPLGLKLGYKAKNFFESTREERKEQKNKEFTNWQLFYERRYQYKGVLMHETTYEKNKPAVIVHTGGTTGEPKGVMLSDDNVNIAAFDCIQAGYDFKTEHNWLNIMPPFIAYGIGNGLHLPLICGMELILIPEFDPKEFDKLMNKYHPNHMTGVPSHYYSLISSKKMKKSDLSYVIAPTVGGDAMNLELERQVNKFLSDHNCSYKIVKGYGMTEVNAAVAACVSNECNKIGSVGIPFPHSIIGIFDPITMEELDYGEIGEVCIQTPNRMLGYYNNPEEEKEVVRQHKDGSTWVHSGDLGYMNEDGLIFIEGRMKNMIVRHDGFNLYPKRIENTILKHPAVKTCMVVGIDDLSHIQGKLPKAYVTLKENCLIPNIEGELKILCEKLLPEYSQPAEIEVRDSLPLTKLGKQDYHALEIEALTQQKDSLLLSTKKLQYTNEI